MPNIIEVNSQNTHVDADVKEKSRVSRNGHSMIMNGVKCRYFQKVASMKDVIVGKDGTDGIDGILTKRDAGNTLLRLRFSSGRGTSGDDLSRMDWINFIICMVFLNVVKLDTQNKVSHLLLL